MQHNLSSNTYPREGQVSLREAREQKGLSAAEVGAIVGVSTGMIYAYEKMAATPKPSIKKRIADLYGYPVAALSFKTKEYNRKYAKGGGLD